MSNLIEQYKAFLEGTIVKFPSQDHLTAVDRFISSHKKAEHANQNMTSDATTLHDETWRHGKAMLKHYNTGNDKIKNEIVKRIHGKTDDDRWDNSEAVATYIPRNHPIQNHIGK
tara:strand:+ start:736 stop:1077 length:342 start_codon:yes stop_codon:yes gene_type:complete